MKKLVKNSFISALLIGILATALWEKFISPFCSYIYIHISSLFETFITTFTNDTYKEISNGFNDSISLYILMIIIVVLLFIVIMINLTPILVTYFDKIIENDKVIDEIETSSNPPKSHYKKIVIFRIVRILLFFIAILSSIYLIGNLIFITDCKTKSICNIEIISPYVSDIEYKQLKSTFYSIQTKEDYINFTETIDKIGEKYSLDLKK